MARRLLTKNVRFRLFVLGLSVVYSFSFLFVLWIQVQASSRRYSRFKSEMEARFDALSTEFASRPSSSVPPAESASLASVSPGLSIDDEMPPDHPRYFVMGSGRTGNWGYFDLLFLDGSCNRYYFRRDRREDLIKVSKLVEIDDFRHRYQVALPSSSRPESDSIE